MRYSLIFTDSYEKIERRFLKRHPDLLDRYHKTLAILEQDPYHPSLRLHALEGRLAGLHAVSINLQYRIPLELELREQEIIFVSVGSHGEVHERAALPVICARALARIGTKRSPSGVETPEGLCFTL